MVYVVTVLAVLVALDLFLTLGVIRRLREHTRLLANVSADPIGPGIVTTGERVGEYEATTVDGRSVRRADLAGGPTVVGFFSVSCPACERRIPEFLAYTQDGPARVLAVVVGSGELADAMCARLAAVPGVVVREPDEEGPIVRAFAVTAYPAFALVDGDGAVLEGGASFPQTALSHA